MRRLRNQRGVAMITVLFVGMVMTVTVSTAAFITVREIRSGTDDQRAGRATAYAEAGIDRMYQWLRSNSTGWRNITLSGCPYSGTTPTTSNQVTFTGQLGTGTQQGTYTVVLAPETTSNSYCTAVTGAIDTETPPPIDVPYRMTLTSTGTYATSTKSVRQVVEMVAEDFPIGVSTSIIDANGSPTITNISVIANSVIRGRNKINMIGTDLVYTKDDFYQNGNTAAIPAAVHSTDRIYVAGGRQEHPPNLNTTGDRVGGESCWDGSGTGGTIASGTCTTNPALGVPPTSRFTAADFERIVGSGTPPRLSGDDHVFFKSIAQSSGIYCTVGSTSSCTRQGSTVTDIATTSTSATVSTGSITNTPNICASAPCYVTAYFEFPSGSALTNTVNWNAATPSTCSAGLVVLIIKNGSIRFGGAGRFSGAIFAEDGQVSTVGNPTIEGTVATKIMYLRGGPNYSMSTCWLNNLPGPFIGVTALRWSEVDR